MRRRACGSAFSLCPTFVWSFVCVIWDSRRRLSVPSYAGVFICVIWDIQVPKSVPFYVRGGVTQGRCRVRKRTNASRWGTYRINGTYTGRIYHVYRGVSTTYAWMAGKELAWQRLQIGMIPRTARGEARGSRDCTTLRPVRRGAGRRSRRRCRTIRSLVSGRIA